MVNKYSDEEKQNGNRIEKRRVNRTKTDRPV